MRFFANSVDSPETTPSIATGEISEGVSSRFDVFGMDCADCAKTIEASLTTLPGVHEAHINFAQGTAQISYDPERLQTSMILDRVLALGYRAAPTVSGDDWEFNIGGMDCADCARTIEAGVRRLAGVEKAAINFAGATLQVIPCDGHLTQDDVIRAVKKAGYTAQSRTATRILTEQPWWRRRRMLETGFAALLWFVGFGLEHTGAPRIVSAIPFLAAMVIAGYPVARAAWFALRAHRADMNLLMTIAAIGAIAIGKWDEGSSVLILFAVGLMLQTVTVDRTRRAIQALIRLAPAEAVVRRANQEQRVPVAQVAVGETVIVRPGERLPVDGVIALGSSAIDQSSITGESIPVEVQPGTAVFAGTINGDGPLEIRSTKPASDSTLARIIHQVEEAQSSRAPAQAFVDRFAAIYTPIVVIGAVLLATLVPLVFGNFQDWFFKALVLLVVACPCALVISTPVALVAAIGSSSRWGVLFKGGAAIEALASVGVVAFDKTGTLTAGRPAVTDVLPLGPVSADDVLARAAAVESRATHPIATSIIRAAEQKVLVPPSSEPFLMPGRGARAVIDGEIVMVGSQRLFPALSREAEQELERLEKEGKTAVLVGTSERVDGIIALADPVRVASTDVIAQLKRLGLKTVMLTGDNKFAAQQVAAHVGVDDVRAELLPQDKVTAITELQLSAPVAMIGDGVNDAPALATAAVGVAMGGGGTDVAIEAADVALMSDDLAKLPLAVQLARRTLTTIRQNIAVSLLIKIAFLVLTFVGLTNLWLAVLADVGVSLLVTFNSMRLLRRGDRDREIDVTRPQTLTTVVATGD